MAPPVGAGCGRGRGKGLAGNYGWFYLLSHVLLLFLVTVPLQGGKRNNRNLVEDFSDIKDFKKLLKTKTNVLVLFTADTQASSSLRKVMEATAEQVRGTGIMATVNCAAEAKKLCKKFKINPQPYILKHYKDGEFNKDYDRRELPLSMTNFMRDPSGDLPWEEDDSATDVRHVFDPDSLQKLLRREKKPVLIMFYAPWCGYCKKLKPDFAAAATQLKEEAVLAGMDVNRAENSPVRTAFNITGFPTLLYFEAGRQKFLYGGDMNEESIISWMRDPHPPREKEPELSWADEDDSRVLHLTEQTFGQALVEHSSLLIMFYAPWCGHCKKMKPEFVAAADRMEEEGIGGRLAAVDATREKKLGDQFKGKGFPTVKYFKEGDALWDFNDRTADAIVEFMKAPKEPPPPPPPEPAWAEAKNDVDHLTADNFKTFLKKKKHALVMFYAPWCGHCKKAKPEFETAATEFLDDHRVSLAAVDCTAHQSVCAQFDVGGYPTFKYLSYFNKQQQDYNGGRVASAFIEFLRDPENPAKPSSAAEPPKVSPEEDWADTPGVEHLHHLTASDFHLFMADHKSVLVMFYSPWCGHCKKMKPAFGEAAAKLAAEKMEGKFATVDATAEYSLTNEFDVRGYPTLKYFEDGKYAYDYPAGRNYQDLVNFMGNPTRGMPAQAKSEL